MRVFVSYSRADAEVARFVQDGVEAAGHQVWVDTEVIVGGEQWREVIFERIQACEVMIVLLSSTSVSSADVAAEVQLGSNARKRIVPVRLEDVEMSGAMAYLLAGRHHIDLFPQRSTAFPAVLTAIEHTSQGQSDWPTSAAQDTDLQTTDQSTSQRSSVGGGRNGAVLISAAGLVMAAALVLIAVLANGEAGDDAGDATSTSTATTNPAGAVREDAAQGEIGEFCAEAKAGSRPISGPDLQGCVLDNADLTGLDLSSTNLSDASLRGANLSGTVLSKTDLRGADLTGVIITGAHLYRAELEGSTGLDGIDWSGTLLERSMCDDNQPCDFAEAVVINSNRLECSPQAFAKGAPIASTALNKPLLWQDHDEDCLHDEYERANGSLLDNSDTDGDGLLDGIDGHGGDETPLSLFVQVIALG